MQIFHPWPKIVKLINGFIFASMQMSYYILKNFREKIDDISVKSWFFSASKIPPKNNFKLQVPSNNFHMPLKPQIFKSAQSSKGFPLWTEPIPDFWQCISPQKCGKKYVKMTWNKSMKCSHYTSAEMAWAILQNAYINFQIVFGFFQPFQRRR